jgi:HEAT repeat protein
MKAIGSPAPLLQFAGAMGLIELPTAEAEEPLKVLLSDEDESVRLAAIGALHKLGRKEHSQELISALGSADRKIRSDALMILGRMGDKSAIDVIRPLLEGEPIESVRLQAAEALVLLGDHNALPKLQLWQYSTNSQQRVFAVQLMGQVEPPPDFTADLLQAMDDPNQLVQLQAARSLGRLGQQAGYGKALKYLDPPSKLRRSLAEQMGISTDDPQIDTEISKIRALAALALGEIGRWEAAKHLGRTMDDRDAQVALASAYSTLKLLIKTNQANIQTIP